MLQRACKNAASVYDLYSELGWSKPGHNSADERWAGNKELNAGDDWGVWTLEAGVGPLGVEGADAVDEDFDSLVYICLAMSAADEAGFIWGGG